MNHLRNKVQLIGNLGKDPEFREKENKCVVRISIATKEIYKNQKGEKVEEVQWHNNIIAFSRTAVNINKILRKGDEVGITGKLRTRSYQDKEGVTRYITEVIVKDFVLFNKNNKSAYENKVKRVG